MRRRQGATATEYMLVLSVIVIAVIAGAFIFIGPFREGVLRLGKDVKALLSGEPQNQLPTDVAGSCPYTFDPRTGRWHDPNAGYAMVGFSDAKDAGCK